MLLNVFTGYTTSCNPKQIKKNKPASCKLVKKQCAKYDSCQGNFKLKGCTKYSECKFGKEKILFQFCEQGQVYVPHLKTCLVVSVDDAGKGKARN